MGDARRRKLFDPEYGKSHRVTESITHIIGIPDDRLTGKYAGMKSHANSVKFSCMTPDAVKKIIAVAKENKLDRYVMLNPEADDKAAPMSIEFVTDLVAKFIDEKVLHSCAAQELADILLEFRLKNGHSENVCRLLKANYRSKIHSNSEIKQRLLGLF